MSVKVITNNIM